MARDPERTEIALYDDLDKLGINPYDMKNYLIYGESIKLNIENRLKYKK
jgi:hypothetical protein